MTKKKSDWGEEIQEAREEKGKKKTSIWKQRGKANWKQKGDLYQADRSVWEKEAGRYARNTRKRRKIDGKRRLRETGGENRYITDNGSEENKYRPNKKRGKEM